MVVLGQAPPDRVRESGRSALEVEVVEEVGVWMVGREFRAGARGRFLVFVLAAAVGNPADQILKFVLDPFPGRVVPIRVRFRFGPRQFRFRFVRSSV